MSLGVLCGSTRYTNQLRRELEQAGHRAKFFSQTPEVFPDCIEIDDHDVEGMARTIKAAGVDRLVFAGTFTNAREKSALRGASAEQANVARFIAYERETLALWEDAFVAAGVQPTLVWDVLSHYRLEVGQRGDEPMPAAFSETALVAIVEQLRDELDATAGRMPYGCSHAVVMEDGLFHHQGRDGTNALLARMKDEPRKGPRALIKFSARGAQARLDPPTFGRITIEHAAAADVCLIASDGENGVFIDRARGIEVANDRNIAIFGMRWRCATNAD